MDKEKIIAWGTEKMKFADESPLETGYRYYHGLRVAKLALGLAERMGLQVDRELLYIGGFLHDVGKASYKGPEHGPRGAKMISDEIADLFTPNELALVLDMVGNHYMRPNSEYFSGKERPTYPSEVLLVQDADTLDHFGSNAVWLAFHWSTLQHPTQQETIDYYHTDDPRWRQKALQWVNYDLSRNELSYRLKRIDEFFAFWQQEESGLLTSVASAKR